MLLAWRWVCAVYLGPASWFVHFTRARPTESACAVYSGLVFINTGTGSWRSLLLHDLDGTGSQTHCALIATAHWNTCAALKISCSSRSPPGAGGCTRPCRSTIIYLGYNIVIIGFKRNPDISQPPYAKSGSGRGCKIDVEDPCIESRNVLVTPFASEMLLI